MPEPKSTGMPMSELRDRMSDEDREKWGSDYQASRGGWYPSDKPTPGKPKRGRE